MWNTRRVIRRVRRFTAQPRPKRRLLVATFVLLSVTEALLTTRLCGLHAVQRTVSALSTVATRFVDVPLAPDDVVWAIDAVGPSLPESVTCLRRALVAQALLEDSGHPSRLRIGVLKTETGFEAHAWVEYEGRVLIGALDDLSRFVPLPTEDVGL